MTGNGSPSRYPLVTILMFVVGLPLLLPGVCSFLFSAADGGLGLLVSLGGVLLIIFAVRRLVTSPGQAAVGEGVKLTLLLIALGLIIVAGVGIASLLQVPMHWR